MSLALADIFAARTAIRGIADNTPLVPSPYMTQFTGADFLLKLEIAQPVGAFKLRGAINAINALPSSTSGVICCSTGNHGRAVAYAAAQRGIRAAVCMSRLVPQVKVDAIRALRADVRIAGHSQDDAASESRRLCEAEGLVEIPPFDDEKVTAGQGTIGIEMLEVRPDLSTILVPLSGGGLAAGIALAAKAINPKIRIVGVSMATGAAMYESIRAGHPVEVEEVASLADSLGGGIGADNRLTFQLCSRLLDDVLVVSEEDIRDAMQVLFFEDRIVAEGASVVGLAAVLSGKLKVAGPAAAIVTGRNLDMKAFNAIMSGEDIRIGDRNVKGRRYGA